MTVKLKNMIEYILDYALLCQSIGVTGSNHDCLNHDCYLKLEEQIWQMFKQFWADLINERCLFLTVWSTTVTLPQTVYNLDKTVQTKIKTVAKIKWLFWIF